MRHIHDTVLAELEHDRLRTQAFAFLRRLRSIGEPVPTGAAASVRRMLARDSEEGRLAALAEFDGYSCGAELALVGPTPLSELLILARRLETAATETGAGRAEAFAHALAGEAALHSGFLRLASVELAQAAELHHTLRSSAGEAHSLRLLAQVRLAGGDAAGARRLLEQALPRARWSRRARHLVPQVYGAMITAAPGPVARLAIIDRAEALVRIDSCAFCVLGFTVPALSALADAGELERAHAYAERIWASMRLWAGTAVEASVSEALAHLARAEGEDPRPHLERALSGFDAAARPLDVRRVTYQLNQALAA